MDVKTGGLEELLARRLWVEGYGAGDTITVAELHRELVPYPLCREELDLATKAEYDVALLGLLDREDALEMEDGQLAEEVGREIESPEPGLGLLGRFAASFLTVRLSPSPPEGEAFGPTRDEPDAVGDETPAVDGRPADDEAPAVDETPAADEAAGRGAASVERDAPAEADAPETCLECGTGLPARPDVSFCPYCGADQTATACQRCGTDLEPEWSFCPACGAPHG